MDYLERMQLVALLMLLLVSLFCMADSLHTPINDHEITVTPIWLGGVASYESWGFDSSAGQIYDGTLGERNYYNEEFMMDIEVHRRPLRKVPYYINYGALAAK